MVVWTPRRGVGVTWKGDTDLLPFGRVMMASIGLSVSAR